MGSNGFHLLSQVELATACRIAQTVAQWTFGALGRWWLNRFLRLFRLLELFAAIVLPVVPHFLALQHVLHCACEATSIGRRLLQQLVDTLLRLLDEVRLCARQCVGIAARGLALRRVPRRASFVSLTS